MEGSIKGSSYMRLVYHATHTCYCGVPLVLCYNPFKGNSYWGCPDCGQRNVGTTKPSSPDDRWMSRLEIRARGLWDLERDDGMQFKSYSEEEHKAAKIEWEAKLQCEKAGK